MLDRLLDHACHSRHIDDIGLQRTGARLLDRWSRVAPYQAQEAVDVAHTRPGLGGGEQTLGVDADGRTGLTGLCEQGLLIAASQLAYPLRIVRRIGAALAGVDARVHLDELTTVVDPYQVSAMAHLDTLPDVVAWHRIQSLAHCQVMIAVDPHLDPRRHLIGHLGHRQQQRLLVAGKVLDRTLPRRAMDPLTCGPPAPALSRRLRLSEQAKLLTRNNDVCTYCTERSTRPLSCG